MNLEHKLLATMGALVCIMIIVAAYQIEQTLIVAQLIQLGALIVGCCYISETIEIDSPQALR